MNNHTDVDTERATPIPSMNQRERDLQENHGHVPVLRDRMVELLRRGIAVDGATGIVVDGTLGAGGHTEHLLATDPNARVIGVTGMHRRSRMLQHV